VQFLRNCTLFLLMIEKNIFKLKSDLVDDSSIELKTHRQKKSPVEGRGNLMFSQRNNPYCDLLQNCKTNLLCYFNKTRTKK
jgi:hypothetical protein